MPSSPSRRKQKNNIIFGGRGCSGSWAWLVNSPPDITVRKLNVVEHKTASIPPIALEIDESKAANNNNIHQRFTTAVTHRHRPTITPPPSHLFDCHQRRRLLTSRPSVKIEGMIPNRSVFASRVLPYRRNLSAATIPALSTINTAIASPSVSSVNNVKSNFHTSIPLQRPGYKPERNPKIGITLEQLRMASRRQGRRVPICHDEQEKVMNSLEAAKYENHAIYKYVLEYDKCREEYDLRDKGKDKALMKELNKYLVRGRKK